jgi:hypothetical protein
MTPRATTPITFKLDTSRVSVLIIDPNPKSVSHATGQWCKYFGLTIEGEIAE